MMLSQCDISSGFSSAFITIHRVPARIAVGLGTVCSSNKDTFTHKMQAFWGHLQNDITMTLFDLGEPVHHDAGIPAVHFPVQSILSLSKKSHHKACGYNYNYILVQWYIVLGRTLPSTSRLPWQMRSRGSWKYYAIPWPPR